jgi:hypothetical protein
MVPNALSFGLKVVVVLALLNFMQNEYETWRDARVCDAKCEQFGCKTGQLLLGQNDQTIACMCESKHDYLMPLN